MKGKKYPAPFATAIVAAAGFARGMEPIHVGILVAASVGISLISPPVGGCRSVACGIGNLPMQTVVRALIPFYPVLVVTVLAIGYVPEIALFIPRLLGYLDG